MKPSAPEPRPPAALVAKFEAALVRLAAAADGAAAGRALEALRAMAGSLGVDAFATSLDAAAAALEPFDPAALSRASEAMRATLSALAGGDDAAVAPDGASVRTLIVDDSPTIRRLVRGILARDSAFVCVGEAADGAEGLRSMNEAKPDLILLDIEMPVLDGFGFLRGWALAGTGAVLVLSSAAPPGSILARQIRQLGAQGITGKPSGALSFDLAERRGAALLAAARRAAGLSVWSPG